MNIREIADQIGKDEGHEIIFLEPAETFDKGIVGLTENNCSTVIVYSYGKLVDAIAEENKDADDPQTAAVEWIEYNTLRSLPYMGPYAPIIIHEVEEYE